MQWPGAFFLPTWQLGAQLGMCACAAAALSMPRALKTIGALAHALTLSGLSWTPRL